MSLAVKANLGCGPVPLYPQDIKYMDGSTEGWLLVDKYIKHPAVTNWDMEYLKEVPDNHFEKIYSSHAVEHIPHRRVGLVLAHWYSKMKEGGELIINVPDLMWCFEQMQKYENYQIPEGLYSEFFDQLGLLNIIYGSQLQVGEVHFCGFTKRALTELLKSIGFKDISVERLYDQHEMGVLIARCKK